jgi:DNA (cytosine-5)-methyltransferase 1
MNTATTKEDACVVAAFLAQHNTMPNGGIHPGAHVTSPLSTITSSGAQQSVVAASLVNMRGQDRGGCSAEEPTPTFTAAGNHLAEVRAFLIKYYSGGGQDQGLDEPAHTDTTHARMGLVMVHGEPYQIVDIGMRMLTPRERFRAQGFGDDYIIDRRPDGSAITATKQGACAGNSVCPNMAEALVAANCFDLIDRESVAA